MSDMDQESQISDTYVQEEAPQEMFQGGEQQTPAEATEGTDGWNRKSITVKLFVGQVPKAWEEEEVSGLFKIFADIIETQIIRDTQGQHRGCAFVKFASLTQADIAIASLNESCFLPGVSFEVLNRLGQFFGEIAAQVGGRRSEAPGTAGI